MTKLLLVVIAVMWIVVLVPPLLRSRSDGRPGDSILSFRRQLTTLQRSAPFTSRASYGHVQPLAGARRLPSPPGAVTTRPAPAPPVDTRAALARLEVKRRRQTILLGLVALCVGTSVIAGTLYSATLWYVSFVFDALLVAYVFALVQIRKNDEARALRHAVETWSRAA